MNTLIQTAVKETEPVLIPQPKENKWFLFTFDYLEN